MKVLTLFICALSIYVAHGLNLYEKGCNNDDDCNGVAKCLTAGCLGTQCLCPENYMPNDEYTQCVNVIDLGEPCGNPDSICRLPNTRCSNGICACKPRFIPAVDNKRCKKQAIEINKGWALLNESCSAAISCTDGHTMICDGVCKCTAEYREATPADLSAFPENGECVSSSYTLGTDISSYRKFCLSVPEGGLKDIGEECTTDTNCPGNATCQQVGCAKKCSCEADFAPSDDRKNCLKLVPLEKACNADTVCETLNSRCSNEEKSGLCICDYGYEITGASLCRMVSGFPGSFKYATINESCVSMPVKIYCQPGLVCTNGICQCDSADFREASVLERIAFNSKGYCVPIAVTLNPTDANKDAICAEVPVVSSQTTHSTANIFEASQPAIMPSETQMPIPEPSASQPEIMPTDTEVPMPKPSASQSDIMPTDTEVPMPEPSTSQPKIMPTDTKVQMPEPSASQLEILPTDTEVPMPEPSASQPKLMPTDTEVPMPEPSASQPEIMPTDTELPMPEPSASQLEIISTDTEVAIPEPSAAQPEIMPTDTEVPMPEPSASQPEIMPTDTEVPMPEPSASQPEIMPTDTEVPMPEPSASQPKIMPTDTEVPMPELSASQPEIMPTDTAVPMPEPSASQPEIMPTDTAVPMPEPSASQPEIMPTDTEVPMPEPSASQLEIMPTDTAVPMPEPSASQPEIMPTDTEVPMLASQLIIMATDVSHVESLYTSQNGIHSVPISLSPTASLTLGPLSGITVQSSPGLRLVDSTAISIDRTSTVEVSSSMYINDTEIKETTEATTTAIAKVGVFDSCADETVCPANAECKESSCTGNKCFCKQGYFPANKDTECLKGVKLGEDCNDTITCSVPFSWCKEGKCDCGPVLPWSTTDGFCTRDLPSVGERCTGNNLCHGMAHCNSTTSLCECDTGFREADEAEVFSAGPAWIANGRCIKLVVNEVSNECEKVEIGKTCATNFNCPENSTCISAVATGTNNCNKRCWCDVGFAPSADSKSCLPVIKIGETCDRAINRCITPLSRCIDNKCECFRGFESAVNNTFCKPEDYPDYGITTPILGETCDNGNNRCVMKGEQICSSGKCECRVGLRPATYFDQLALYYDMRQCRNDSVPEGYRPPISCSDPPLPQVGRPDFDLPDKPSSDLKRNQLIMYVLVPVAVIAAAVMAIIYTAVRRRRVLAQKDDDASSVDSETDSTSSFHLPRPHFNLGRFRSDKTWTEPQTKYNSPNSRVHKQ